MVKNEEGVVQEIHCQYDPETKSGCAQSNRKVKATIHWLSAAHVQKAEVRLFDRLFTVPDPDNAEEGKTFLDFLNPNSLQITEAWIEPTLSLQNSKTHYQFERIGYFVVDKDSTEEKLIFNKTVNLKQ